MRFDPTRSGGRLGTDTAELETIDVVDISRLCLQTTTERYDLITAEPPPRRRLEW